MTGAAEVVSADRLRDQSGYASPIVIVFLSIVAALSARFVGEARLELEMQRTMLDRVALQALARDVTLGFDPSWISGSRDAPVLLYCTASAYDVMLAIWQLDRLTDLNTASAEDIAAALGVVGVAASAVDEIAADVIRFRSYDPHGHSEAGGNGVVAGLKRGPLETVEELADFDALATIQPARLRQVFTIRQRTGGSSASAWALEVRAARRDGRAAALFGAVVSIDPTLPQAQLIEVYDPDGASASPSQKSRPCPEALARLIAQRLDIPGAVR